MQSRCVKGLNSVSGFYDRASMAKALFSLINPFYIISGSGPVDAHPIGQMIYSKYLDGPYLIIIN